MSGLRRLDEVLVPRLRSALGRLGDGLRRADRWETSRQRPRLMRAVATRPGVVALAAGLVVFGGSFVHAQRLTQPASPPALAEDPVVDAAGVPLVVGPRLGSTPDTYLEVRGVALADQPDDVPLRAVISFRDYVAADDLEALGVTIERLQVRLPLPDDPPKDVEVGADGLAATLERLLEEQRRRLAEEEADVRSQVEEGVEDPDFQADYERRLDELRAARNVLGTGSPVVFAAVVVADAATLRRLADLEAVRLVDPAGPEEDTRQTQFYGLLPEDTDRITYGRSL